jgi:hypothetical protein
MTSDAPSPQPAERPPPPPPPPAPPGTDESGKASGGMRALGVLIALVLAFGAAVMIAVAIDIGDTSTCDQFFEDVQSGQVVPELDDECFDGSEGQKSISVVLAWASGIVGAIAVLVALMFAVTGNRGPLLARVAGAAVALGILSILIGSI